MYYRPTGTAEWATHNVTTDAGPATTVQLSSAGDDAGKTYEVKLRAVSAGENARESDDSEVIKVTTSEFPETFLVC